MKNLKHIALFLSCLVIASCTKDIDEKEPSNECSILDIQLTGQLGKATIERVDDNQGTVTLYIFEQANYLNRIFLVRFPLYPTNAKT